MKENVKIVVPWHNHTQLKEFLSHWGVKQKDKRFVFQQDWLKEGCGVTKNKGVQEAMARGAEIVIILDDDCYPNQMTVDEFIRGHVEALQPQPIQMFRQVTMPPSRGTPYYNRTMTIPVAASMGFWEGIGDYDAIHQAAFGANNPMVFSQTRIYGEYFPLCGMNLAFKPGAWLPWCSFIEVSRYDDIWMGFLLEKAAYARGHCFNLNGPTVIHSRQSNVWQNLRDEAKYAERNETLWRDIALSKEQDYEHVRKLLPV